MMQEFLDDAIAQFRKLKEQGEKAINQVNDEDFFATLDDESNSIALIIKHLAGNMKSRWTDFLTTDGEKTDRNRDQEFVIDSENTREEIMRRWKSGWDLLFEAVVPLKPEDLAKTVYMRGEPHSVLQAINRQLTHYTAHIGQIIFLAKHYASSNWQTLSVARGKSEEYNRRMFQKRS